MVAHFTSEQEIRELTVAPQQHAGARPGTHTHRADGDIIDGFTLRDGDGDTTRQADSGSDVVNQGSEWLLLGERHQAAGTG